MFRKQPQLTLDESDLRISPTDHFQGKVREILEKLHTEIDDLKFGIETRRQTLAELEKAAEAFSLALQRLEN